MKSNLIVVMCYLDKKGNIRKVKRKMNKIKKIKKRKDLQKVGISKLNRMTRIRWTKMNLNKLQLIMTNNSLNLITLANYRNPHNLLKSLLSTSVFDSATTENQHLKILQKQSVIVKKLNYAYTHQKSYSGRRI